MRFLGFLLMVYEALRIGVEPEPDDIYPYEPSHVAHAQSTTETDVAHAPHAQSATDWWL